MSDHPSVSSYASDFRALGIVPGDVLYLRAGLKAAGARGDAGAKAFVEGALEALGPQGVLIAPAFTPQYRVWKKDIPVTDAATAPVTGGLSRAMLGYDGARRSAHPTHSFVAIGKDAAAFMDGHGPEKACFEPIRKVMERGGKMALVGCVADSPGFSTVHLAQFDLGLTCRHWERFLNHVRQADEGGARRYFRPIESPGCSRGFSKFYSDYILDENMQTGRVGGAWSICVDAARAYAIERARLEDDPRYALCEDKSCVRCRVMCGYNLCAAPGGLWHYAMRKLRRG